MLLVQFTSVMTIINFVCYDNFVMCYDIMCYDNHLSCVMTIIMTCTLVYICRHSFEEYPLAVFIAMAMNLKLQFSEITCSSHERHDCTPSNQKTTNSLPTIRHRQNPVLKYNA